MVETQFVCLANKRQKRTGRLNGPISVPHPNPAREKKTEIDKNKNLVETITLIEPVSSSVRLNFLNDSSSDGWHNKQPQTKNNDDNGNERGNKVELHLMCYSVSHDAVIWAQSIVITFFFQGIFRYDKLFVPPFAPPAKSVEQHLKIGRQSIAIGYIEESGVDDKWRRKGIDGTN